jgi:hypothetical protein
MILNLIKSEVGEMKWIMFIGVLIAASFIITRPVQADVPKISNLQFSANPIILGEWFTISLEYEGDVDRLFIENTWETKDGAMKREVKEYIIPSEVKEKPKGVITRRWLTKDPTHKPYRLFKVWVKDVNGNQSNALSGEVKVATVMHEIPKDARDQTKWPFGLWTGILAGKQKNRILEINEVSVGSGKANYGTVGGKLQPISVTIKGEQVSFTTPPGSKVELKRISEFRMDGTFEAKGYDLVPIQFWKKPTDENLDPQLKAFLRTWQGKSFWEGAPFQKPNLEFDMKITIAYIDSTAAAVLRENSEFISLDGPRIPANWCWCHATVTRRKTIEFSFWNPEGIFVCKLSSDLKYLNGEVRGLGAFQFSPNSFKLRRADN